MLLVSTIKGPLHDKLNLTTKLFTFYDEIWHEFDQGKFPIVSK